MPAKMGSAACALVHVYGDVFIPCSLQQQRYQRHDVTELMQSVTPQSSAVLIYAESENTLHFVGGVTGSF